MLRSPRGSALLVCATIAASISCRPGVVPPVAAAAAQAAPATPPPAGPPPCEISAAARARVPGLLAEGRIDRVARILSRCPKSAPEAWGPLVTVLAELGKRDEARRIADAIDASPTSDAATRAAAAEARKAIAALEQEPDDAARNEAVEAQRAAQRAFEQKRYADAKQGFLDAWAHSRPNGAALLGAGRCASELGDRAGAQRLFDRAMSELEQSTGKTVAPDAALGLSLRGPQVIALSQDGRMLAIAAGRAVSIRDGRLGLRETARIEGHAGDVLAVAFSPDGKTLASAGETVRVWDVATGALLRAFARHTGKVVAVAFSPDGGTLAWSSDDGTVRLWSDAPGVDLRTLPGLSAVLAFSPDGKTLAATAGDGVSLRDVATGAETRRLAAKGFGSVVGLAFSADGKTLAAAHEEQDVETWDVATGASRSRHALSLGAERVPIYAISSALEVLTAGAVLWRGATGAKLRALDGAPPSSAVFSGDGKTLASIDDAGTVRVRSGAGWATTGEIPGLALVGTLAFSPDGRVLASTSPLGDAGPAVRLWSGAKGAELRRLAGPGGPPGLVTFSHRGDTLATLDGYASPPGHGYGARLWNVASGAVLLRMDGLSAYPPTAPAFSPDDRTLVVADGYGVLQWDLVTGAKRQAWNRSQSSGPILALSPGGEALAGSLVTSSVLWDAATGAMRELRNEGSSMVFSPDGATLAMVTPDRLVHLCSAATGAEARALEGFTGHLESFAFYGQSLAFSSDGQALAAASSDGSVHLWSVATGVESRKLEGVSARSLAFSARALAWSSRDGAVRLASAKGDRLVALRALQGRDAGFVLAEDAVELVGHDAEAASAHLVCRVGALSFPFELCRERFEVPGLLARALVGEGAPDEPLGSGP